MSNCDFISSFLGSFGKWQFRSTFLVFLVKIPSSWFMACLIFTAKTPPSGEIYCKPEINNSLISPNFWIKAAHPYKYDILEQKHSYNFCYVYNNSESRYRNETTDVGIGIQKCENFKQIPTFQSIIHQYQLYCSRDYLVPVTQSFHLLGVLIGGIIATQMLKKKSPREVMLIGMITQIFFGLATGLAPTYILHITFRCAVAATCSLMCIGIMTLIDITSGKYQVIIVCLFEQFWSIGVMLLPIVASSWHDWRLIYVAITLPTISLFFIYPWIPDSPRWLLKHGRTQDALNILLNAARVNRKEFDENQLKNELNNLSKQFRNEPEEPSVWSIWKGNFRHKINMVVAHIGWSVYLSLYFASLLHVRALGSHFLPVNTIIAGVSEIIGTFIGLFLILKKSNKWMWACGINIITSVIGLSANFIPSSFSPFQRIIIYLLTSMLAKITISTTLALFITCTSELVSIEKKKVCNYSGVTCSRTIVMAAPFIGYCSSFGSALISQNIIMFLNISMSLIIALFIKTPRTCKAQFCSNEESEQMKTFKTYR